MNAHSAFQVATPFDSVAESYDTSFTDSFVGKTQRNLVWREMDQIFRPGQRILEINCGTGVDAVHLAQRGVRVVACDASSAMIRVARQRAADTGLGGSIEFHIMATEKIYRLYQASPFDGLLSNFAGLNCVLGLEPVVQSLGHLLKPGADALLCIFGRHCLWELIWNIGRGDFEKAFRRFRTAPIRGSIGGQQVDIRYWSVGSSVLSCPTFTSRVRSGWASQCHRLISNLGREGSQQSSGRQRKSTAAFAVFLFSAALPITYCLRFRDHKHGCPSSIVDSPYP